MPDSRDKLYSSGGHLPGGNRFHSKAWHGGEAQAELLTTGLRARGHEVSILARAGTPFPERIAKLGYETTTFPGRGRSPFALWQIRRHLTRTRPDVMFFNDPHSLTAGTIAAYRSILGMLMAEEPQPQCHRLD